MIRIKESNMVFEFDNEHVFMIENSLLHKSIGDRIKSVEFIVSLNENELYFVEAKSSSPKPVPDNNQRFDLFVNEISEKFIHSFNMFISALLERNKFDEIPQKLFELKKDKIDFKFILIIKDHAIEWLPPLQLAIQKKILPHLKIWDGTVLLMNEDLAKQYRLAK